MARRARAGARAIARVRVLEHDGSGHRTGRGQRCGGCAAAFLSGEAHAIPVRARAHLRVRQGPRAHDHPLRAHRGQWRSPARDRPLARAAVGARHDLYRMARDVGAVLQHARRSHRAGRTEGRRCRADARHARVRGRAAHDLRAVLPLRHRGRRAAPRAADVGGGRGHHRHAGHRTLPQAQGAPAQRRAHAPRVRRASDGMRDGARCDHATGNWPLRAPSDARGDRAGAWCGRGGGVCRSGAGPLPESTHPACADRHHATGDDEGPRSRRAIHSTVCREQRARAAVAGVRVRRVPGTDAGQFSGISHAAGTSRSGG